MVLQSEPLRKEEELILFKHCQLNQFVVEDFVQLRLEIVNLTMNTDRHVDFREYFPMHPIRYLPQPVR